MRRSRAKAAKIGFLASVAFAALLSASTAPSRKPSGASAGWVRGDGATGSQLH